MHGRPAGINFLPVFVACETAIGASAINVPRSRMAASPSSLATWGFQEVRPAELAACTEGDNESLTVIAQPKQGYQGVQAPQAGTEKRHLLCRGGGSRSRTGGVITGPG